MKLWRVAYGGSFYLTVARTAKDALMEAAKDFFSVRLATTADIDQHPGGAAALQELYDEQAKLTARARLLREGR